MGLFGIPGLQQVASNTGILNNPVAGVFGAATVAGGLPGWALAFISGSFTPNAGSISPGWALLNSGNGKSSMTSASKQLAQAETFSCADTSNSGQFPYNYAAGLLVFNGVPQNAAFLLATNSQAPALGNLTDGSQLIVGVCNINTYGAPPVVTDSLGRFSFTQVYFQPTAGNNSGNVAIFICPRVVGGACTLNIAGNVGGSANIISTSPFIDLAVLHLQSSFGIGN